MTALVTVGLVGLFVISVMLFAGAGATFLHAVRLRVESPLERLLVSVAMGVVFLELAASIGELLPGGVRAGVNLASVVVAAVGWFGIRSVTVQLRRCASKLLALRGLERYLAAALILVLAMEGLASLAPLTGSDALHYHFTVQQIYLSVGFQAPWSLLHGFFCGLGHQIILSGLALGSGRLAQLWLFLGGTIATLATYRVAGLWTNGVWPWLAALAFALTPVSVWQITSAGAPDIWMCALAPLSLLLIVRAEAQSLRTPTVLIAGVFAGGLAGSKYTGILLAAALLAGLIFALRSFSQIFRFMLAAVVVGIWTYLRNWVWTGDPVFPFLFVRSHAMVDPRANTTAIWSILSDTGATHSNHISDLLKFVFFAAVDYQHLGAWQLLGPLVLAFAPIAIPQLRKSIAGCVVLIVWITGAVGIGASSGMARFLLPLLPLALGASLAGVGLATEGRWPVLRALSILVSLAFCAAGLAGMVAYSHQSWSVALGHMAPDAYLSASAPEYQPSLFVNREVARRPERGRVLVFFHHLYYLNVPYFNGDPNDSWEMNPAQLNAPEKSSAAWRELFRRNQIRWVVRAGGASETFANAFAQLENEGVLIPCVSGEAEDFSGNRIAGVRIREPISLLCVR